MSKFTPLYPYFHIPISPIKVRKPKSLAIFISMIYPCILH